MLIMLRNVHDFHWPQRKSIRRQYGGVWLCVHVWGSIQKASHQSTFWNVMEWQTHWAETETESHRPNCSSLLVEENPVRVRYVWASIYFNGNQIFFHHILDQNTLNIRNLCIFVLTWIWECFHFDNVRTHLCVKHFQCFAFSFSREFDKKKARRSRQKSFTTEHVLLYLKISQIEIERHAWQTESIINSSNKAELA